MAHTKLDLAAAAHDELQKRRDNYPRWVREGKMKQATADARIEAMAAIYRVLVRLPDEVFKEATE